MALRFAPSRASGSGAALALAAVFAARSAEAQSERPAATRLVVERSAGAMECADERQTRERVTARLGYDPFRRDADALANLRWERRAGRFVLTITLSRPGRTRPARRTITSRDRACDTIGDTMSLALAIAIDPVAAARVALNDAGAEPTPSVRSNGGTPGGAPGGATSATAPASSGPPSEFAPSVRPSGPPLISWVARLGSRPISAFTRWFVAAQLELTLPAAVPTVDVAGLGLSAQTSLGVGVARAWWSARMSAWASLPARLSRSAAFDLWNLGFTAAGCAHPVAFVALCALTAATLTGASSAESNVQLVASSFVAGWALGGRVAWEPRLGRSPFSLLVALEGLGWIATPTLRLDAQALWSRPRLTAALTAGIAIDL